LGFAVDRTNADLRHARNRVRRLLVPLLRAEFNPRLGPALAALAERLRDEDDFLAVAAAGRARGLIAGEHLRTAVAEEPPALARRIVQSWLERGARRGVGAVHVARVLGLAAGAERGAVAIPGPARVVREGDVLARRPGRAAAPSSFTLEIAPGRTVAHGAGRWRVTLSAPRARPGRAGHDADRRSRLRARRTARRAGAEIVRRFSHQWSKAERGFAERGAGSGAIGAACSRHARARGGRGPRYVRLLLLGPCVIFSQSHRPVRI